MRVLPVYYVSCISLVRNFLPSFFNDDGFFLGWLSGRLVKSVGEGVPHAMIVPGLSLYLWNLCGEDDHRGIWRWDHVGLVLLMI
jgi:hypothetical protein